MPRPRKPARLWFDEAFQSWCILDAGKKVQLGLGKSDSAEAERRLEAHLLAKRSEEKPAKNRRADQISCAEVLERYGKKATVKRPEELAQRLDALLDYWGELSLDDIDEDSCTDFVDTIGSASYGRRCLEDFRAAVNGYARAGFLRDQVKFTLPEKPRGRVDWLTFKEAVALCRTAWRHREVQRGNTTNRWTTRHVAKFIAVAIVTCSRSARIHQASYVAEPGRPFADLENALYYRAAPDEKVAENKQAPPIPITERLLASMRRWHARGDQYVVEWAGRPADCKKAFSETVERAKEAYPHLFKRADGTPKHVVRHILRHTGITWLAISGEDPYEICKFAGLTIEIFETVYGHHHPDYMAGIRRAQEKRKREPVALTDSERAAVAKLKAWRDAPGAAE